MGRMQLVLGDRATTLPPQVYVLSAAKLLSYCVPVPVEATYSYYFVSGLACMAAFCLKLAPIPVPTLFYYKLYVTAIVDYFFIVFAPELFVWV